MFGYQNHLFVTIGWKVINPHILQTYFGGHLGLHIFHQRDSFGLLPILAFTMSFCVIFAIYSEKKELVMNLLNV